MELEKIINFSGSIILEKTMLLHMIKVTRRRKYQHLRLHGWSTTIMTPSSLPSLFYAFDLVNDKQSLIIFLQTTYCRNW